jgi:hypothetical protein
LIKFENSIFSELNGIFQYVDYKEFIVFQLDLEKSASNIIVNIDSSVREMQTDTILDMRNDIRLKIFKKKKALAPDCMMEKLRI